MTSAINTLARVRFQRLAVFMLAVFMIGTACTTSNAQQGRATSKGPSATPVGLRFRAQTLPLKTWSVKRPCTSQRTRQGSITSPPLVLGSNYTVTVKRDGFQTSTITSVAVTVGSREESDFALKVGNVSTTVEVESSQAEVLETTSGTLGAVIGEKSIEDLPLNGRNTIALTTLTPGVRINATVSQSGFANRGTNLSAISINGSPTGSNSYILDGQSNLSTTTGEIADNPTVDAIQEFKVQSGVFSAQYGFTLGGVVNLVSRTGNQSVPRLAV